MHLPPDSFRQNYITVGAAACDATTITAGLALASSGDTVYVFAGTYTESFTIPAGVQVYGPGADVVGAITLGGADSICTIRDHTVATGVIGCTFTVAGRANYTARDVTCAGTGIGVLSTHASGELTYTADHVSVATGFAAGNLSGISGHLHYTAKTVEFSGAGSGIVVAANGHVIGSVDSFGGGAGTAINVLADAGRVHLSVDDMNVTAAWTTVPGGEITINGPVNIIAGTQTGTAKVNGRYVLQSGDTLATDVPADGSVLPVAVGDKLWDGNTDTEAVAVDVGGTKYWLGGKQQVPFESTGVATTNPIQRCQWSPTGSRKAVVVCYDGHYMQSETTTGTNYYTVSIKWKNATLATFSTQSASEDVQHRVTAAMGDVIDFADLDELADATGVQVLSIALVKSGTQILRFSIGLVLREVLE